jgi:hypothetical protein
MLARMWEKGTRIHCLWEGKLVQPLWKAVWRSLQKLKIEPLHGPVISLLGINLKECTPGYDTATCTPMFIVALFTVTKLWKQPRSPTTDKWIKKMWCHKEGWNSVICR